MKARTSRASASGARDTGEAGQASRGTPAAARRQAGRGHGGTAVQPGAARAPRPIASAEVAASIHLCIPDDQLPHFPQGQALPAWPAGVPWPRVGEVLYLSSTTAWAVCFVIHEFVHGALRTEVWLEWVGASRHVRHPDVTTFVH